MSAIFPIPHITVRFPNGDRFDTEHVDHLYNLHLEIHAAYPMLPLGEFSLKLVEENEEEERAVFQLIMDDQHLHTDVILDETGELWIFEIMFSWWLAEQEEDGAYDSWSVSVAVDPSQQHSFYGLLDEEGDTVIAWHKTLNGLLAASPCGRYSETTVKGIADKMNALMEELRAEEH
jgi:hypothetical protein